MLQILGNKSGVSRRQLLQVGGAGMLGMHFDHVLNAEEQTPQKESHRGRAKAVIFVFLFCLLIRLHLFSLLGGEGFFCQLVKVKCRRWCHFFSDWTDSRSSVFNLLLLWDVGHPLYWVYILWDRKLDISRSKAICESWPELLGPFTWKWFFETYFLAQEMPKHLGPNSWKTFVL